ncbi:hypothetical protein [Sphingomonas yunnanensis]|nr:hypothetical protein [Sphingomonas yunnanensis]
MPLTFYALEGTGIPRQDGSATIMGDDLLGRQIVAGVSLRL